MSFTGTLSELALCDLVEITSLGGKTGVLDVAYSDGASAGRLAFRDGTLVSASCGALSGERAFYALIGLREGSFVFDPDLDPGAADGDDLPTGSLLMEAMRRVDEIGRLRDAVPSYGRVTLLGGGPDDPVEATVSGTWDRGSAPSATSWPAPWSTAPPTSTRSCWLSDGCASAARCVSIWSRRSPSLGRRPPGSQRRRAEGISQREVEG